MIYFDNAATTLRKPESVAKAVSDAILNFGNPDRGAYEASLAGARMIYETRQLLCTLFHASSPEQIAFTSNATEALNIAIQGLLQPGDHAITTALEHNSVLRPLYLQEDLGISLTILPADEKGNINYDAFEEAIRPDTEAIICTHASNLTGNMLDLYRIGDICYRHNLHFIVDASQTAGMYPLDMETMHISALCFTGHKSLMGPQGTGGICLAKGMEIRPLKVGGSGIQSYSRQQPREMPTALEAGTLNSHGIAGLHAALIYLKNEGTERLRTKELLFTKTFYEGVRRIPGVKVYGDFEGKLRAPIVSINIEDYDSGKVSDELFTRFDIATRSGAHCAPLMHESLGTKEQGAVRFSFSSFNTMEEVKKGIEAVRTLAEE